MKWTPPEEGLFHVAGNDRRHPSLAVQRHVDDEVASGHAADPRVLLVDRVAFEDPVVRPGILEERGAVPQFDGLEDGDPRADELPASRIPGHQVRFDKARGDLEPSSHVTAVDPGGDTPRGRSDQGVLVHSGAVVVLDTIGRRNLLPEHLDFLGGRARPVHPGGDQDEHPFPGNAGPVQHVEDRPEQQLVRHRPRDVADDDAGVVTSRRQFP